MENVPTIGVVLAGGRSSRMGQDKALVVVAGRPMIDWVSDALQAATGRVLVVGRDDAPTSEAIPDLGVRHRGPLSGLAAATVHDPGATLVIVAVDQPWVRPATLQAMIARTAALPVVPVDDHGNRQTTCAVFPSAALVDIGEELEEGGSIQSLLDRVAFDPVVPAEWQAWGEDGRSWFSVDTPEDAATGLARFGPPAAQPPM